jgi:hypothetical protein
MRIQRKSRNSNKQSLHSLMRRRRGVMGTMTLALAILIVLSMSLFAIDMAQLVCMRDQLRNAADAAATAGAQDLYTHPELCEQHAYTVAESNLAFDLPIKDIPNILDVHCEKKDIDPEFNNKKTVHVDITMTRRDIISPIIGRMFDTLHVKAVAGGSGHTIKTYGDTVFPLAVDLYTQPGPAGNPLPSLAMAAQNNQPITIVVQGDQLDNGAWTNLLTSNSVPSILLEKYLTHILGDNSHGNNQTQSIPPVCIDQQIGLKNGHGVMSIDVSQEPWRSILLDTAHTWVLPVVITGNDKFAQTAPVKGFVTVQFTSITPISGGNSNNTGNGNTTGNGNGGNDQTFGVGGSSGGNGGGNAGGNSGGNGRGNGVGSGGTADTSGANSGSSASGQGLTLVANIVQIAIPGESGPLNPTGNNYGDASIALMDPPTVKLLY